MTVVPKSVVFTSTSTLSVLLSAISSDLDPACTSPTTSLEFCSFSFTSSMLSCIERDLGRANLGECFTSSGSLVSDSLEYWEGSSI